MITAKETWKLSESFKPQIRIVCKIVQVFYTDQTSCERKKIVIGW